MAGLQLGSNNTSFRPRCLLIKIYILIKYKKDNSFIFKEVFINFLKLHKVYKTIKVFENSMFSNINKHTFALYWFKMFTI